jgi:L-asparaginase/archaeal Glu-tRNAGln amidotransferase subunit D
LNLKKPVILPVLSCLLAPCEQTQKKFNHGGRNRFYRAPGRTASSRGSHLFEYKLYRANRSTKINAHHFQAFDSPNYPWLMRSGVHMEIQHELLLRPKETWQDVLKAEDLEQSIY